MLKTDYITILTPKQRKKAQIEILLKQNTLKTQIAKILNISRSTLYRKLE